MSRAGIRRGRRRRRRRDDGARLREREGGSANSARRDDKGKGRREEITPIIHDLPNNPVEALLHLLLGILDSPIQRNDARSINVAHGGGLVRVGGVQGRFGLGFACEDDERDVGASGPEGLEEERERVEGARVGRVVAFSNQGRGSARV